MAKYPSTLLPQDNTPQENQKAVLDLLDKTNKVHDDALSGINAAKAELQKQIDANSGMRAYVCGRGNPATAGNTAIQFTETLDTHNLYASGVFVTPKEGVVLITACIISGSTTDLWVGKNANPNYLYLQSNPSTFAGSGTVIIPAAAGDTFYVTTTAGASGSTLTSIGIEFTEL